MSVASPASIAFGILLVLVAIPVGLSLGPLVLGAVFAVIGLRRLHRAMSADSAALDPLAIA